MILKTDNLVKRFGGLIAVNEVSIGVEDGSITLLIGPNGCGKTTFVNSVSGYYKPDGGKVYFQGEDTTGLPLHKMYQKGLVRTFQIPSPFLQLSVLENLLLAERNNPGESFTKHLIRSSWKDYEADSVDKAIQIMRILGLEKYWDKEPASLDAGALKLIEIGRALMAEAKMVILDEPIAGVNPKLAHNIFSHIVKLRDEMKLTFLIIEHRLDIALKYVDFVYAMHQGRIIARGTPDEIARNEQVRMVYVGG
ncbi:MAG: ABC transporter ATP-binding protein [Thermoproteota archaeon]|jgi:branched-chain amino acid transport system ATP-binding protein|uniref:Probable branched-chain amino acid transport ATP-binding protein LivG n=1 Tax=Candidatus Methanodesulfokora washburnensis TaxID=2478471 RepID=A0A3R9R360_9CREN|nr:ABC transporter ATP-binding protein [Candidatus Methanodesulfokores washburnensis]RSN73866.1 ABC transporter ATP-binding protein [Candidatus Methanodesulfokores washburnensis]TDA42280.1 MAG: ABC transporter ATP-binding protein [Candidatus Korarchaeota archaeon]